MESPIFEKGKGRAAIFEFFGQKYVSVYNFVPKILLNLFPDLNYLINSFTFTVHY